ncbi:TPA: hypothetical protein N0F65_006238 [Lagenidium giganteum]|uniref:BZIP domain-containing protein n=1 Tax=Lagenidium giganteum TaxID=4803 RepID=A0AAV2Z5G0_9STRA|nr:TPA: hypothetical protein N0F65_006238 [Lagenidium giganteum]
MSDAIELKNPSDRKAKRRQQVAISARRHRCRKKHEMINLKKEVSHLTSQLELLRSRHKMMRKSGAIAEWEETAMAHRRKRRQAEQESEALRRAIFLQSGFLQELKSAFSSAPIFNMEMNLRELLHTYIHLGKNARTRMRDYETICSESKLDMALEIVRRETKHIKFDRPFMASNPLKLMGQFGTNHVSVYSFEGVDLSRVFFAACKAVQEHGFAWPDYCSANIKQQTLEEPSSNIQYSKATVFYKNCKIQDEEAIVVESRSLYYYRFTESYGIMVWDFVDQDDLHPLSPETQIRRDMVGSLFVSREMCDDGVQRVVCRCVCTKLHEQNKNNPAIERFSTSADSAECGCGKAVYDKVKQNIVGNEEVPAM